ncbi:putative phage-type endonuclease [Bradyrhizobium elkanii]|jgi:putative phage-type endonuclease|uniref:lambda exonuclease family protein n=1 Tax=Bradyrhizobium elkanii TaxID=29448 RepID=UPI0021697383|nr:lambda exonuclease family protein [Bradyrhizobium elkanii]MCS3690904.1 putative phage-type endonuclease [Bradyrhizobium elkanii]
MSLELIQGSAEWKAYRCGRVTASRIGDIIAKTKTGWGASRANYLAQLVAERLTGEVAESYSNAAMQWGTEKEPDARAAYEFRRDEEVVQVGFIDHPSIPMAGCSPDGLVGDDGMIEIKAPLTATHIETLLDQTVPSKYEPQIQWQMACTGRQWVDFVSFDPRMPEAMSLFVTRVERDDARIAELEKIVRGFLAELDEKVGALKAIYARSVAA